jgi:hypothetical protein
MGLNHLNVTCLLPLLAVVLWYLDCERRVASKLKPQLALLCNLAEILDSLVIGLVHLEDVRKLRIVVSLLFLLLLCILPRHPRWELLGYRLLDPVLALVLGELVLAVCF